MNKFLKYAKLLLPVKGRFILAIIAGVIYGLASGFGLPYMVSKVFPLLFSTSNSGIVIAVKGNSTENPKIKPVYFDLGSQENFNFGSQLYISTAAPETGQTATYSRLPEGTRLASNGIANLPDGSSYQINQLYHKLSTQDGKAKFTKLDSRIYTKNTKGEYQVISSATDQKPSNKRLILAALMLPGVFLIRGIFGYMNTYLITYCGNFVLESLRLQIFAKMQRLDLAYFQKTGTGDLITRIMTQSMRLQQMLTATSNEVIKQPITFLAAIGALIYMTIKQEQAIFILICLGIIPVIILPVRKLTKSMLNKMRDGAKGESALGNCVQENIQAARDIRSFNLEEEEIAKFEGILGRFFTQIMKMTKYRSLINPMVEFITTLGIAAAIYIASQRGLTLEGFIPIIVAIYISYEPIKRMGQLQSQLALGKVAIERLESILDAEEKVTEPENPKTLPPIAGAISFNQVLFRYEKGKPALKNASIDIKAGDIVALVGPSGAGKSTFTHLITRTYEYQKGSISFDGLDVRDYALKDIRKNVSVVSQDPYLFNDTIENNIRLGKLDATDQEIQHAAQLAHCHEFIHQLPKGYQTIVGEKATRLSGGQRQRLAIARAFLKDAPILILDEATSALDAESEQAVQGALEKLVKGRTTLIIAHRFSSIQIATRILVFDQGNIAGDGNHESLLQDSKLYRELYQKQMLD